MVVGKSFLLWAVALVVFVALPSGAQEGDRVLFEALPERFQNWLKTEVCYIISPSEREKFLRLESDDKREKFVEEFWAKRDPTPGTPDNEAREEHYRRLALANAQFGGRLPGWRTDRGSFYIRFGLPDAIESYPSGIIPIDLPLECWRYDFIEGVGKNVVLVFADVASDGVYPMQGVREEDCSVSPPTEFDIRPEEK